MDYLPADLQLALGIDGLKKVRLRGCNTGMTNAFETVWGPSSSYVQLTTAVAMELVSSSANDTAAGTGARTVQVIGLDGSYVPFTETVTLNGTTPVALANTSAIAINALKVLTAGSGGINAGTIDCRAVSGSAIKRQIPTPTVTFRGGGQDSDFIYTIPANHIGVLMDIYCSTWAVTGGLIATLLTWNSSGLRYDQGQANSNLSTAAFNNGKIIFPFGSGFVVPEKTLIDLRAYTDAGTGTLSAQADLYVINKSGWIWGTGGL